MTDPHAHSNKPVLLAVGLFVSVNGFSHAFESLFEHLSAKYSIHWIGLGYEKAIAEKEHYTLYPINSEAVDIYGAYGAAELATRINATAVLLLNDFCRLKNYERAWQSLKDRGIRLMAYVSLNGYFNNTQMISSCLFFDHLIFYSRWAEQETRKAIGKYFFQKEMVNEPAPALSYIYHGVNTHIFKREANADIILANKKRIFKVDNASEAVFILNANSYNERKDIAATLRAFKKAVSQFTKPTYLCLHMPEMTEEKETELFQLIHELDLAKHIIYNPLGNEQVSNEELCTLYQCCPVGINTSLGESWGAISFEHAACGGAQLVPAHTTPGEVWENAALLIEKAKPVQLSTSPFLMYSISEDMLAKNLALLVNHEDCLQTVSDDCYQFVQDDKFNWKHIAMQWEKLIERSLVMQ